MKVDDIAMTPSNDDLLGDLLGDLLDLAGEDLELARASRCRSCVMPSATL